MINKYLVYCIRLQSTDFMYIKNKCETLVIIDWESLHTYANDGNIIFKKIPIYKIGVYKGKLWLDKDNIPSFTTENLGLTGYKIAFAYFDIWDENTRASAKKVRVVFNNNLEKILPNASKWGEEQLVKIEWATSSFPGNRRYQRIYLLPVPK